MPVWNGFRSLPDGRTKVIGIGAVICALLGAANVAAAQKTQSIAPECGAVFGGKICIGGTVRGSTLRSLTATIPLSVIEGVPAPGPMVWPPQAALVIQVPERIKATSGVDHFTFYWEPMGHPPAPFMTPHFDFHFYVVDNAARLAMDCKNEKKPESLPAGYALKDMEIPGIGKLVGVCVPGMGMHSLPEADLAATAPFKSTMVMGFYDQKPIFFEPMISRARLLEKKSFSLAVPTPAGLPSNVHYPRRFKAKYDKAMNGYRFEFTGFR